MENKENDVSVTDPAVTAEAGGHSALNVVTEISLTESTLMKGVEIHSCLLYTSRS